MRAMIKKMIFKAVAGLDAKKLKTKISEKYLLSSLKRSTAR